MLMTLEEHEKFYEEFGRLFGWCHTCNKAIWTTEKLFGGFEYCIPETCKSHNVIIKYKKEIWKLLD